MQSLRTSSIASIVDSLRFRLHLDPIAFLPPEIITMIFSYLSPSELLRASQISKSWRERCLDGRVWKQKYHSQGWGLKMDEIRLFEQTHVNRRDHKVRRSSAHADERRQKRQARQSMSSESTLENVFPRRTQSTSSRNIKAEEWGEQSGLVEADDEDNSRVSSADRMQGVEMQTALRDQCRRRSGSESLMPVLPNPRSPPSKDRKVLWASSILADKRHARQTNEPPLISYTDSGRPRINYHQIYKQRRTLEDNWTQCHHKPFQLPHRDYPEEAHTECVYTLQFIGRFLVSGSRDKTLRIWDLDTQRLIRKPLVGHTGSVLCLQFDNSEKEDIIISGSSDTDVILWRYSTGQILQKIHKAHKESVLNLKFDQRFLVTSSKDKTIKIWNRRELSPGDKDYPRRGIEGGGKCPSYIIDLADFATRLDLETKLTVEQRKPLQPYTTLMVLDNHTAAVNAIHIHKNQLVSASGDKTVKIFDIHTGKSVATCLGHNKGIACVQYDGTRIVSGSSDNSIRIFDPITQAQVACLEGRDGRKSGHSRLVRTIQTAFEDLPGSKQQLEDEAAEIDRQFTLAKRSGWLPLYDRGNVIPRVMPSRRTGSRHLFGNVTATGAKLPPGGGGSRWGRIVSGSYDETIIIWRKGPDGTWFASHRLRQEEALRAAGPPLPTRPNDDPAAQDLGGNDAATANIQSGQSAASTQNSTLTQTEQSSFSAGAHGSTAQNPQHAQGALFAAGYNASNALQQNPFIQSMLLAQSTSRTPSPPSPANASTAESSTAPRTPTSHPPLPTSAAIRIPATQGTTTLDGASTSQPQTNAPAPATSITTTSTTNPTPAQLNPSATPFQPQTQPSSITNLTASNTTNPPPANSAPTAANPQPNTTPGLPVAPPAAAPAAPAAPQPNARVFKLQFDARRIICCSQDPKIVGWDFANGDEAVIACSRFFGVPS